MIAAQAPECPHAPCWEAGSALTQREHSHLADSPALKCTASNPDIKLILHQHREGREENRLVFKNEILMVLSALIGPFCHVQ